jgi:hypothetical protein
MRTYVLLLLAACGSNSPADPTGDGQQASGDGAGSSSSGPNGNPDGACAAGIPARGMPVDVSQPTTVVGTGTAASCTNSALASAIATAGVVTFDCGSAPVTIAVTASLEAPVGKDLVLDGGNKVTLDGGDAVSILRYEGTNFQASETKITLQHIAFAHGRIAGSEPIPMAPAPCSQGFDAGDGGAVYVRDANLTVIDSLFTDNNAAPLGPDVGGGAIRMIGSKHGVMIVGSTFRNNKASNGAAVGCLFSELDVYNSLVESNTATGHDANNDDATMCSVINNGQHEIGSGGNGGSLYSDGVSTTTNPVNVVLCGDKITGNAAGTNAFGGGLFFTSNNFGGDLTIADTVMTGNTGGHWTNAQTGSVMNAGTAVGTNTHSITITNSTLQGL